MNIHRKVSCGEQGIPNFGVRSFVFDFRNFKNLANTCLNNTQALMR